TARAKTWMMTYHGGHIPRYGLDPFPFDHGLEPIRAFTPVLSRDLAGRGTKRGQPYPIRQHRRQDIVAQEIMLKQSRGGMEAGQPNDDIAQDRVDVSDRLAETRDRRQHRSDIADAEDRERMVFRP